jgi:hypothetical protein
VSDVEPDYRSLLGGVLEHLSASVRVPSPEAPLGTPASLQADPAELEPDVVEPDADVDDTGSVPSAPSGDGGEIKDVETFMASLSGTESGGNPHARNARTGASGTFQIMPGNWAPWAREAGVDPSDTSAEAQNRVARHKLEQYFEQFGSWGAVAVAWYAGPGAAQAWVKNPNAERFNRKQGGGDEPSINEYVARVTGGGNG